MKNLLLIALLAVGSLAATAQKKSPESIFLSLDVEAVSDAGVSRHFHKLVTEVTYDEASLVEFIIMNDTDGEYTTFDNETEWNDIIVIEHVYMYEVYILGAKVRAWIVETEDPKGKVTFIEEVMLTSSRQEL